MNSKLNDDSELSVTVQVGQSEHRINLLNHQELHLKAANYSIKMWMDDWRMNTYNVNQLVGIPSYNFEDSLNQDDKALIQEWRLNKTELVIDRNGCVGSENMILLAPSLLGDSLYGGSSILDTSKGIKSKYDRALVARYGMVAMMPDKGILWKPYVFMPSQPYHGLEKITLSKQKRSIA